MNGMYFDIQRFSDNNSSIDSLERLGNVINALDLKNLADEFLNSGKTVTKFLKDNVNPILKFIGTFLEAKAEKKSDTAKKFENYSTVITSTAIIVDSALAVVKYAKEKNTDKVYTNIGLIASELTKMVKAVVSLNSGSGKASLILGIVASTTSLVANGISALDGLDDNEKAEINKAYVELMKSFGPDLVKKIFNDAIASEIKKASVKDLEVVKKNISLFNNVSNTLTKAGGVLDLVFALTNGVMNGIDKYKVTLKKYTEDNIPEDMAKRDAFIDAITTVIHDTAHMYTKGLDDVLFRGTQTLVSWITGKQPGSQGNYVEVITDIFKAFNFTNSGTADGDYLLSFEDNMMIYGMDGDDYIGNIFSQVMIYGGHDNDTIVSRLGSGDGYSTPQGNSFFGGPGEDLFMVYDTSSTIDGGTDSDRIAILGKNNKIYGDNGTDAILLESGADGNTISGGLGDDAILLNNAKNTVIEYNEGDGNDIIIGYDESDEIHILANYSDSINGQDVIIGVGNDSIILSGAAGKKININGTKQTIGSKPTNPPLIITLPSVWHEDAKVIHGTNDRNFINSTFDNVIIEALAGNDNISNSGKNVTINGCAGNDYVLNEGSYVKINGNDGDDYINNLAENSATKFTIDGGDGDDKIQNLGEQFLIFGGKGNDTIKNCHYWDNEGKNGTINGGNGNDSIINEGSFVLINGELGDDDIWNIGKNVTINSGDGNDTIDNRNGNTTIYGGSGKDSIYNAYNNNYYTVIDGGADADIIVSYGDYSTINGSSGNDDIHNVGDNVLINGGEGNDYILNGAVYDSAFNVTITGGEGNDTISMGKYQKKTLIEYKSGDGNDTIWGFDATSTLKIIGANYSSVKNDSDVIFTVGNGKIILKGAVNLSSSTVITTPPDTTPTALNLNNTKNNSKIIGSSYDDTITNSGSNVTITSGIGGDSINNSGAKVLIDGDAGSDTIYNNGNSVTINGIDGDDDIYNYGDSVKINGGANYDLIMNYGSKVTVDGNTGNDFIYSNASDVSINADDGFDTISNYGDGVTINGGKNNDTITNIGSSVRFKYASGDGNDLIEGFNETSTLQIGDGKSTYSFAVSEDDAIVTVGENKITLRGAASLSSIHIDGAGSTVAPTPTGPLNLTNYTSYRTINGTSDNDSVWNEGYSVTINSASGNDSIVNLNNNVLINTGDGNDYVGNYLNFHTTINGGAGDDTISLSNEDGYNVIKYASGDGNDTIINWSDTNTLNITGDGLYVYSVVDNDAIIYIDDGKVVFKDAAKKNINITGALVASLSTIPLATISVGNAVNNTQASKMIIGTNYNDTVKNSGNGVHVSLGAGRDSIYNTGYALIDAGQNDDTIDNYSNYSTINSGDGNDYIYNRASGVVLYGGAGSDTINFNGQSSFIFGGANNDSIYVTGSANHVNGDSGNDTIKVNSSSTVFTINGGKGNDVISGGVARTILYNFGDGNDSIASFKGNDTLIIGNGTTDTFTSIKSGSDVIITVGEGKVTLGKAATLSNVHIKGKAVFINPLLITGTNAADTIHNTIKGATIQALDGNDSIRNEGINVTINSGAGNDYIFNLENNVSINSSNGDDEILNGSDYSTINVGSGDDTIWSQGDNGIINGESNDDYIDNSGSNVSINGGSDNDYIYSRGYNNIIDGGTGNDSIENDTGNYNYSTIIGGDGDDYIRNGGSNVTINSNSGDDYICNSGSNVTINAGAGNDSIVWYDSHYGSNATISGDEGNDLISLGSSTSFNVIQYSSGDGNDTISGFNETSTISIANGKYSTKKIDDDLIIKIGNGSVLLKGATTLSSININGEEEISWKLNGATATYGNLVTVTGVKSTSGLNIDTTNKKVTVGASALNQNTVSISSGYTLALGNDVYKTSTTAAGWSLNGSSATYKAAATSAGYQLTDNKISYVGASGGNSLVTITGVKSLNGLSIDTTNKKVTVGASALNQNTVSISNGYTLALGNDVYKTKETISQWSTLRSGNVAYLTGGSGSYYSLNSGKNAITYNAAVAPDTAKIEFSGIEGTPTLSGNIVKLTANNFKSNVNVASNAGGYTLALSGDFKNKTLTGTANADKINSSGSNLVISGGKGNDQVTLGSNNTFLYAKGDGNDILYGFGNDDKIKLTGTTKAQTSVSGKDVIVTTEGGKITVKNAAQDKVVTIIDSKDKVISAYIYSTDKIVDGKSITLTSAFEGTLKATNYTKVDGAAVTNAIKISSGTSASTLTGGSKNDSITGGKANDKLNGNAGNDSLVGGDGKDTLSGGTGNDKLLGGAGNDSLIGGDGKDTLSGGTGDDKLLGGAGNDVFIYEAGNDVIADFTSGQDKIQIAKGKISKTSLNGSDVLFTIGKGSLTVKNAKGKTISLLDSTGKASSTVVGAQALTNSNKASITIAADMGFVDASARTKAIKITGNALNNTISGGSKNDSLFGAAGNDSILGNDGSDKLYGEAGNDILLGGKGNDSLWGGAGNDSLWGDAGKDTFIYTANEGTDKIFDYATGDMLKILSADGTDTSFKSSKFSGGDLTLTINGGGKIIFDDVAFTTKFNINGLSYNISGSKLVKK